MNRKTVSGIMLSLLLICMFVITLATQPAEAPSLAVHNIDTSEDFATIQEAIDDLDTLNGHTILVDIGTYYENVVISKSVLLIGENRDATIIDGNAAGNVVKVIAKGVVISGFTIRKSGDGSLNSGIYIASSSNIIQANTLADNTYGILLRYSDNNLISKNIVENGGNGISTFYSSGNLLTNNSLMCNEWHGISFGQNSNNNTVTSNILTNNGEGLATSYSHNNLISRNIITNSSSSGIGLRGSNDNRVVGNIIGRNTGLFGNGITLSHSSSYNTILGNLVFDNSRPSGPDASGFDLNEAYSNYIIANTIASNDIGVVIQFSEMNTFYHNNLINNTDQIYHYAFYANTWDNGFPSGGNYWSDYEEEYPSAMELDGSGIWDTPYEISENNRDSFPLMEPWTPIDQLKAEIDELGSEGEIDNQGIVTSLIAKLNVAQKLVEDGKIDQAKNILEAFINEVQAQSSIHITPEAAELLIESAEYILSHI